jgi:hypothetical protein
MKTDYGSEHCELVQLLADLLFILQCSPPNIRHKRADVALSRLSEQALALDWELYQRLQLGKGNPERAIMEFAEGYAKLPCESSSQSLIPLLHSLDEEAGV